MYRPYRHFEDAIDPIDSHPDEVLLSVVILVHHVYQGLQALSRQLQQSEHARGDTPLGQVIMTHAAADEHLQL